MADINALKKALLKADKAAQGGDEQAAKDARVLARAIQSASAPPEPKRKMTGLGDLFNPNVQGYEGPTVGDYPSVIDPENPIDRAAIAIPHALSDAATMGYSEKIGAAAVSPFSYIEKLLRGEDASLPEEYTKFREAGQAAKSEAMGNSPMGSAIGTALGLLMPLGGVDKFGKATEGLSVAGAGGMVEEGLRSALPLTGNLFNRIAAGGIAGGLTGAAWDADSGSDRAINALLGTVFGVAPQTLLEVGRTARRALFPSKANIKEATAKNVFGDIADLTGGEVSIEKLKATRQEMGPEAMVADLDPTLRANIGSAIVNGADPKAVGKIVNAAKVRDPEAMAFDAVHELLGTVKPKSVLKEEQDEIFKALGVNYRKVVSEMDDEFVVPVTQLMDSVTNTFGATPIGPSRTAASKIIDAIGSKAEANAAIGNDLRPSDAIEVKQLLDGMVDDIDSLTTPTSDKAARNHIVTVRNYINRLLKDNSPKFAGITKAYGGEFEYARANRLGEKLIASPGKQIADDLRHEFEQLSPSGQQAFQEGAAYNLFRQAQAQGGLVAAKNMTKSPSYREAINTVFGEAKADKLVQKTQEAWEMFETGNFLEQQQAVAARNMAKTTSGNSPVGQLADIATMGAMTAGGNLLGGPMAGATRRTGVGLSNRGRQAVNTSMVNLGSMKGADADAALSELYEYMTRKMFNQPFNPALPAVAGANQ